LSSAYNPISTPLGLAATTETMGQEPFTLGVNLGGRQTQANQAAAQLYQTGVTNASNALAAGQVNAAKTMQLANQSSFGGAVLTGLGQQLGTTGTGNKLGSWFNNLLSGSSTPNWSNPYQYNTAYTDQGATGGSYGVGTSGIE
jgi:hypothetical protein